MNRLRNFLAGENDDGPHDRPHHSKYGYNSNGGGGSNRQSRYNDELYLSDDDDWGMSAFSPHDPAGYSDERRGSSAFWDQSHSSGSGEGPDSNGMELPPRTKSGLQKWEREAIAREGGYEEEFEIGDDDFYHSETRRPAEHNAYEDVEEDIRHVEEEDDGASSATNKDEVVNAYRDYLKSIRDGGFESYLDSNEGGKYGTKTHRSSGGEDEALERDLDIEEERATGSLYGDLYGVNNMRSAPSPYNAWRAKAKALLLQEEERDSAPSPSRQILQKFRKKRSSGMTTPQPRRSYNDDDDEHAEKMYRYRFQRQCQSPKVRGVCICVCLTLALVAGLYYYGSEGGSKDMIDVSDLSIPPKDRPSSQTGGKNGPTASQGNPNRPSGQSDAIANALGTFDPKWYDRRSGWEGITFMDSVNFCQSKEKRVPCPFEIYCTEGANGDLYQGTRPNGEQWSAVSNGANQWVSVGGMFGCQRYTELHDGKKPDWGITGISLEHEHGAGGITQNVLCCVDVHEVGSLDPFTQWGKIDELDQVEADHTDETTLSAAMDVADATNEKNPNEGNAAIMSPQGNKSDDEKMREKAVIAAFQPIWFSSAHGWTGTSYEDAIQFCESYNHMVLCPYAAYCPLGPQRPALPGSMVTALDGEEWVPANGPMNTWVLIGTMEGDESTRCTLHHDLLGERPRWGMDGSRADVKHHIMCCLM